MSVISWKKDIPRWNNRPGYLSTDLLPTNIVVLHLIITSCQLLSFMRLTRVNTRVNKCRNSKRLGLLWETKERKRGK